MTVLLLHAGRAIEPHDLWQSWALEPGIVISLALAALLYTAGLAARGGRQALRVRHAQAAAVCFALGWLALAFALVSPLHPLGNALFSAHMLQHEILMLIAAPLLVLSRPVAVFVWAFPMPWRTGLGALAHRRPIRSTWRFLTNPWFAFAFHAAALWVWHIPSLFQATLESEAIHTFQHSSFFGSALLFWWALMHGREGRLAYGAAVFYVFTTGLHSSVLGALLTFARVPWYPAYAESATAWGLTALEDQQLAGLIMWVPAGCVFLIAGLAFFAAWLTESDWRVAIRKTSTLVLLAGCLFLTSCKDNVARAAAEITGGDPERGRYAAREYGCGACHTIPGIPGADTLIGPSLEHIANRAYIGGNLPNNPGNMIEWLKDPRHFNPQTAMPKTVTDDSEARNIAAYLYTLE
jgi:putative membrane protein